MNETIGKGKVILISVISVYSQFALLAPLDVLGGLLLYGRLVLLLPEAYRHEDIVGAVLALDVEAAGLLN